MSSFRTFTLVALVVVVGLSACARPADQEPTTAATDAQIANDAGADVEALAQTPPDVSTVHTTYDAQPKAPAKEPKLPHCPVLADLAPDAAGNAPMNPADCPADGLGNFETWVYLAWKQDLPIWIGSAGQQSESPGKWYAVEDKSVWADVVEVNFTVTIGQALLGDPGFAAKSFKLVKPGCYTWNIDANATPWAKETFGKKGAQYCSDVFKGAQVLGGGPFLFFGEFPLTSRVFSLAGGKLAGKDSKLPADIDAQALKGVVAAVLTPAP